MRSHELGDVLFVLGTGFGLFENIRWMLGAFEMYKSNDFVFHLFYEIAQTWKEMAGLVVMPRAFLCMSDGAGVVYVE